MKKNIAIFILLACMLSIYGMNQENFLTHYTRIVTSNSILATDYIALSSFPVTIFNVLSTITLALIFLRVAHITVNGKILAGLGIIAGFSFFGKHIFNMMPLMIGAICYIKVHRKSLNQEAPKVLFVTGIAPIVSFIYVTIPGPIGILISIFIGMLVGYMTLYIHEKLTYSFMRYNLYGIGFVLGLISCFLFGLFQVASIEIERFSEVSSSYHLPLLIGLIGSSSLLVIITLISNHNGLANYKKLLTRTGVVATDFVVEYGMRVTLLNIGVMGVLSGLVCIVFGLTVTGPAIGAIITLLGFSACGNHTLNSLTVMLGALIFYFIFKCEGSSYVAGVFFATALAPIAGVFGSIYGFTAGFLHMLVLPLASKMQGGFDLYNNGFSAGIVALILVPIGMFFIKRNQRIKKKTFY